jgi:hypothetical protein
MNLLAIPSSLSRSYSTFPLCSGDNLNWNSCILNYCFGFKTSGQFCRGEFQFIYNIVSIHRICQVYHRFITVNTEVSGFNYCYSVFEVYSTSLDWRLKLYYAAIDIKNKILLSYGGNCINNMSCWSQQKYRYCSRRTRQIHQYI